MALANFSTPILHRLKNNLSKQHKEQLLRFLRFLLLFMPHRHRLDFLALRHPTDKRWHGYLEYYQKYFRPIRKKKMNILEIGVGGKENPVAGGESLRMWRDFFPKSIIWGIDIEDKRYHQEDRIKIFRGSQNDPVFLKYFAKEIGNLDIIIDDGSHINEHVITSFSTLFPYLAYGGIYVIEDLCTSYWPQYGGSFQDFNKSTSSMSMLKNLVDGLNYQCIPNRLPAFLDKSIVSLHFYPNIAFIFKAKNRRAISSHFIREIGKAKRSA